MATVLIAWELGAGLGHLVPLAPIVARLRESGHQVFAAVKDLSRVEAVFGGLDVVCLQAPVKMSKSPDRIETPRNFGHILHNSGFADGAELSGLAQAWRNLMQMINPDVILFDHAPTALLAARGLPARRATIGAGFCCPPDVAPFPDFRPWMPDVAEALRSDEQRMLDIANRVLESFDQPPLARLGQLYRDVDATFLQTFRELDHYPERGAAEYFGVWTTPGGADPDWPAAPGKRIFGYLKPWKTLPELLNAVQQTQRPALLFVDGISADLRNQYQCDTIRFASQRLDLTAVAASCDMAILNGGHNVTALMLLAGKPTMHVPFHLEQAYNGSSVAKLEAGYGALPERPQDFLPVLTMLLTEERFTVGARRFAEKYAQFDPPEQIRRITGRLERLACQPPGGCAAGLAK